MSKKWWQYCGTCFVNANSCILSLSVLETNLAFAYAAYRKHNCMRKLICSSFYKLPELSKSMSNQFYTEPSAPVKHSKHASNCLLFCISDKMSTQRVESGTSDEQLWRLVLFKSEDHRSHLSMTKNVCSLIYFIIF